MLATPLWAPGDSQSPASCAPALEVHSWSLQNALSNHSSNDCPKAKLDKKWQRQVEETEVYNQGQILEKQRTGRKVALNWAPPGVAKAVPKKGAGS